MITPEEYLRDPCGSLSIPYWKWKTITVPEGLRIVHHRDWKMESDAPGQRFFRLRHDLRDIPDNQGICSIRTASEADIPRIVRIIRESYPNIRVTEDQMQALRKTPVFDEKLWIMAENEKETLGCAIADLDRQLGEGILEWVQVLPQYRRRGVGRQMVCELLKRMQGKADFATVSGDLENPANPERLYRSCGFRGNDVWHIIRE